MVMESKITAMFVLLLVAFSSAHVLGEGMESLTPAGERPRPYKCLTKCDKEYIGHRDACDADAGRVPCLVRCARALSECRKKCEEPTLPLQSSPRLIPPTPPPSPETPQVSPQLIPPTPPPSPTAPLTLLASPPSPPPSPAITTTLLVSPPSPPPSPAIT